MSLQSWREEFYPTQATIATSNKEKSIKHSILKWAGLSRKNLEKHDLMKNGKSIFERSCQYSFDVDDSSCALCLKYVKYRYATIDESVCSKCPLYKYLGESCDAGAKSPYKKWVNTGNNLPMLKALKALLINNKKGNKK